MANYAAGTKLSELTLVDAPVNNGAAAESETSPAANAAGASAFSESLERFLAEAALEFDTGHIEQPLWARAMEKAGGDAAAAKAAYLHARATKLLLEKRDRRAEKDKRRARALPRADAQDADAQPRRPAKIIDPKRSAARWPKYRSVSLIAFALVAAAVVAGWVAVIPWGSTGRPDAAGVESATARRAVQQSTKASGANETAPARHVMSTDDFRAKVLEFRDAGNWNVLVLYAAEWTRKEPGNADAWKELSRGYQRLRQYRDALDAATRAVQLAPADFQLWQEIGQLNVELGDEAAALAAFEQASQLNARDVLSLVSIGTLQTHFGRLPDARTAFAKALAVSPGDVEALCGAEAVAQKEGRLKDAEALRRDINADGRRCRDANASEIAAVAVSPPAAKTRARALTR